MWLLGPDRTCQLGYPNGTGLVGWALPFEKSWSLPTENPNLSPRGCFHPPVRAAKVAKLLSDLLSSGSCPRGCIAIITMRADQSVQLSRQTCSVTGFDARSKSKVVQFSVFVGQAERQ
jgi:hypothetical protein